MTKIISHKNILKSNHTPVLAEKVLENLNIRNGLTYVDGTFGAGGHTSICLLYTSPSPRDGLLSRMPSSA